MSSPNNLHNRHVALELEPTTGNSRQRDRSPRRGRDLSSATSDAEPLVPTIVTSNDPERRQPPVARPEFDEDEEGDDAVPNTPDAHPGVDDGFFPLEPRNKIPDRPPSRNGTDLPNGLGPRRPSIANIPYAPSDFGPGFVNINGVPTEIPDVNVYQHKKTLAQGMMDLALLSANANQLRYILESRSRNAYFYVSLVLLSLSLFFQIAVGVGLILNSRYNVKDEREICKANRINNFTVIGIFIVTVVNVFISAFGVSDAPSNLGM